MSVSSTGASTSQVSGLDHDEIVRLTEEYGGQWGLNHTRRLLHLIDIIGEGRTYDMDELMAAFEADAFGLF